MKKRTKEILKRLDEAYGTEYICYLNHNTPWQLLIAVMLPHNSAAIPRFPAAGTISPTAWPQVNRESR